MNKNRVRVLTAVALPLLAAFVVACVKDPRVITQAPRFAYTPNENDSTISGYEIDPVSGALAPLAGSPFAGPMTPRQGEVCLSGQLLYVSNGATNGVSAYKINATTGRLTTVPGSPFAGGAGPRGIAVTPSGQYLYTANRTDSTITGYKINNTTGALTQVAGSPFPVVNNDDDEEGEAGPQQVAIDPTGSFLYASNHLSSNISAFTIAPTTGTLTEVSGSPFGGEEGEDQPFGMVVSPSGDFLFVANHNSDSISVFRISSSGGGLTEVEGSPFFYGVDDESCDAEPLGVAISPSGQFLYVTDFGCAAVTVFNVDPGAGTLSEIEGSPYFVGSEQEECDPEPNQATLDPTGKFLYVANIGCNNIAAFTVDAGSGSLTPLANSPFLAGSGPYGITVARLQLP